MRRTCDDPAFSIMRGSPGGAISRVAPELGEPSAQKYSASPNESFNLRRSYSLSGSHLTSFFNNSALETVAVAAFRDWERATFTTLGLAATYYLIALLYLHTQQAGHAYTAYASVLACVAYTSVKLLTNGKPTPLMAFMSYNVLMVLIYEVYSTR